MTSLKPSCTGSGYGRDSYGLSGASRLSGNGVSAMAGLGTAGAGDDSSSDEEGALGSMGNGMSRSRGGMGLAGSAAASGLAGSPESAAAAAGDAHEAATASTAAADGVVKKATTNEQKVSNHAEALADLARNYAHKPEVQDIIHRLHDQAKRLATAAGTIAEQAKTSADHARATHEATRDAVVAHSLSKASSSARAAGRAGMSYGGGGLSSSSSYLAGGGTAGRSSRGVAAGASRAMSSYGGY
ncbi:hypothetical protein DMC30DRAFT_415176 [Rhodotorula diobovata]|uniref:Uncharacterized protein n=1 Tax=Rhodotorula diobovata TaxID=5288 RepID=A0A5C5G228_9BASI|nr:hypothetical protein DMC30DRAFT_415176 [Rhodotorula diobovata]